ncbi:hypothetical protein [Anaeromyxobacter oryzae]|uniref:Uncharacterized protein n=1 Tax=Anaeromyxobacter oryzae TaxID=2918170 RepID=A0ABM7WR59_9BACT|nr:hypothetical protein [Anaeromyxobacter oryzae]BDG01958.1 hypothetical protein AMOR_09540 [Anaeromyxobacter oryzae]
MVEILEQGAISFLAVVSPGTGDPDAWDVARFFVVLAPAGRRPLRRLSVRRRRLPEPERAQRFYAHVDRLAIRAARLTDDVRAGRRPGRIRVLAVGRYTLARHGDHVHLAYALARACGRGGLARALGVRAAASFLLCVFRRSLPPPRRPAGPLPLAAATPERLDVLGAEIALVAGGRDGDGRLGIPRAPADRVGETLASALLRRGPRPRIASMTRA